MAITKTMAAELMKTAKALGNNTGLSFYENEIQVFWNGLGFTCEPNELMAVLAALDVLQAHFTDK